MKDNNAQIIIDVVMGELQKKESFSNSLSKVAQNAINKGMEKASKIRKTALSQAITEGFYKETPASKRAIKKLAKTATLEVSKAVEDYNSKHKSKGGFWNFVGSLAVNTGVLRFGQGYKGGNFFRDRYIDTSREMDKAGNITLSGKANFGRIAGDIISSGQFLAQSFLAIADIISSGINRIQKKVDEGLDNAQEITAIANTLGLGPRADLKGIAAGVNVLDSLTAGTNIKNLGNILTQHFSQKENEAIARKAGMRGITAFDLAMEYVQMLISGKKFDKNNKLVDMSEAELKNFYSLHPVMATPEFRRTIQQNASVYPGMLFAPGGKPYNGKSTLYSRAYSELGSEPLTSENFKDYKKNIIDLELYKLTEASKSFLSIDEKTKNLYGAYYKKEKNIVEREIKFFKENAKGVIEAQIRIERILANTNDLLQKIVADLVNPEKIGKFIGTVLKVAHITAGTTLGVLMGSAAGPLGAVAGGTAGFYGVTNSSTYRNNNNNSSEE